MNEKQFTPHRVYARPADRSLAAYKDFILTILAAVNPEATDDHTEEWWREAWQEFWGAAGAGAQRSSEEPEP